MEHGHVGAMKIVWTALPGIATLQIRDLDIRLRPNLTAIASREIAKKIEEIKQIGEQDEEDVPFYRAAGPSSHPYYISPFYPNSYQPPIHDTTATVAAHCKIPRPPRVVRQAQYVVPPFSGQSAAPNCYAPAPNGGSLCPPSSSSYQCPPPMPSFLPPPMPPLPHFPPPSSFPPPRGYHPQHYPTPLSPPPPQQYHPQFSSHVPLSREHSTFPSFVAQQQGRPSI
eukprot:GHVS01015445.1.p1 GENE.GHVS01015445.1~~GHVS01015445.1.p1  ORF type:complete len:225 (+),score=41.95 GHVS01015445.1:1689-2363(+)